MGRYILDENRKPVAESDLMKWVRWFEKDSNRRVALTKIGEVEVSTIFLGLDYQFGDGTPILWETMVFGGEHDGDQDRCSGTWEDAEYMHAKMVKSITG